MNLRVASRYGPRLLLCLATLYFLRHAPQWFETDGIAPDDWAFNLHYIEAFVTSIQAYGVWPLWNPWSNGGFAFFENPGIKTWSIDVALALLFGTASGAKLSIVFHYFAGFAGWLYLSSRVLHWHPWVGFITGLFFLFSSFVPLHLIAGHGNFSPAFYLVWVAAFFLRAIQRWGRPGFFAYLFAAILVLELMLYSAAFHFVLHAFVVLAVFSVVHAIQNRDIRAPLVTGIIVLGFLVMALHAILPMAISYSETGFFESVHDEALGPSRWWAIFTNPTGNETVRNWAEQQMLWWEYGNYTGPWFFVILILLLPWVRRRHLPLILGGVVVPLLFLAGDWSAIAPYRLAVDFDVPIFRNLRAHGRWSFALLLSLCLLLGDLLQHFLVRLRRDSVRLYKVALMIAVSFGLYSYYDLQIHNTRFMERLFPTLAVEATELEGKPILTIHPEEEYGHKSACMLALRQRLACGVAYEMLNTGKVVRWHTHPEYIAEFYDESGTGLKPVEWNPNRLRFDVREDDTASGADIQGIIVNQNYDARWVAYGGSVYSSAGRLAVRVDASSDYVELVFHPFLYYALLCLSVLLHVAVACMVFYRIIHRRALRRNKAA